MLSPIYGDGVDIVHELNEILDKLHGKQTEQDRNSFAHAALLDLTNRLRPKIPELSREEIKAAVRTMSPIEAIQFVRARLGLGLREAKDYYDNMMRS